MRPLRHSSTESARREQTRNEHINAWQGLVQPSKWLWADMQLGSTAKVLADCKLKYHRISDCVGSHEHTLLQVKDGRALQP